ncbi:MAG: hypothetical protein H6923_07765 [Alphaproteobacteria bacterium]|nr:hypothetical protein [Alphaproteobacteria bacterium]
MKLLWKLALAAGAGLVIAAPASAQTVTKTCDPDASSGANHCPLLSISGATIDPGMAGENGGTSWFRGFADPAIRKHTVSGVTGYVVLYSHLYDNDNPDANPGCRGEGGDWDVRIDYATSSNGVSWNRNSPYGGILWDTYPDVAPAPYIDPETSESVAGTWGMETANLVKVTKDGQSFWVGTRQTHFSPEHFLAEGYPCGWGGFKHKNQFTPSQKLLVTAATTLTGLATDDEGNGMENAQVLVAAGANIDGYGYVWGMDYDLTQLPSIPPAHQSIIDLCHWWNEPALHYDATSEKLFLAAHCWAYTEEGEYDSSKSHLYVFSTDMLDEEDEVSLDAKDWEWYYEGPLGSSIDAELLTGSDATDLTQIEFATHDGALLAIVTPQWWNFDGGVTFDENGQVYDVTGRAIHLGCMVLEVDTLERDGSDYPDFVRQGTWPYKPVVRDYIVADYESGPPWNEGYDGSNNPIPVPQGPASCSYLENATSGAPGVLMALRYIKTGAGEAGFVQEIRDTKVVPTP